MNILIFSSLAYVDIEFYNGLYQYFSSKGARVFLVIFEKYNADLRKLIIPWGCYIYLGSSSIDRMNLPSFLMNSKEISGNFLKKIIDQEIEIYQHVDYKISRLYNKASAIYRFIDQLLSIISPSLVLRFHSALPTHAIIRYILRKNGIKYIDFERWAFPKTYVCSEYGYWSSNWQNQEIKTEDFNDYKTLVEKCFLSLEQIYLDTNEQSFTFDKPYILYLSGDGISTGTSIKNSEEYESIGCGWGDDKSCVLKIESLLSSVWPKCNLIIRQHPYTRPKLSTSDISEKTKIADHAVLEDLLSNAEAIICSHTGLIYHAMKTEKMVAVIGHHELEKTGVITCCHNLYDLDEWLKKVIYDKDCKRVNLFEIIDITARYAANSVVFVDHKETFQLFDKYLCGSDDGTMQHILVAWYRIKINIWLFRPYFFIKRVVKYFRKLVRVTFVP